MAFSGGSISTVGLPAEILEPVHWGPVDPPVFKELVGLFVGHDLQSSAMTSEPGAQNLGYYSM